MRDRLPRERMAEAAPIEDPPMEVLSIGNDGSSGGPGAVGHQSAATKPAKKGKKKRKVIKSGPTVVSGVSQAEEQLLAAQNRQKLIGTVSDCPSADTHDFWDTQPVPKLAEKVTQVGALVDYWKEDARKDPMKLPDQFEWCNVDIQDDEELSELYTLLLENYVEGCESKYRFDYSREFLRWALLPPGWKGAWHCGVRVSTSRKLVGFISAIPALIRVHSHQQSMVEINFLCVHKKLRSKRVAPVLIKEITRRVNIVGIFQAVYTVGEVIPKPFSTAKFWHRSLNVKKLVEINFASLHGHMTLQRMIRINKVPNETKTPGLRPYQRRDATAVLRLLNEQMGRFDVCPVFASEAEVDHWFTPRERIIDTFVVESASTGEVTDMISFYHLPSSIVRHPTHKTLYVAYLFYYGHTTTPLKDLIYDMLVIAKKGGCDVFNSLDIMENSSVLEELKFGEGDGNLHYYFYNFKCPEISPDRVGVILP